MVAQRHAVSLSVFDLSIKFCQVQTIHDLNFSLLGGFIAFDCRLVGR